MLSDRPASSYYSAGDSDHQARRRAGSTYQEVGIRYEPPPRRGLFWYGSRSLTVMPCDTHTKTSIWAFLNKRTPCGPPGRCARCGDNVVGDGSGCIAMEQVFHVECFTCITCHARLRGQPFYALDKKSYCESCYIVSQRVASTSGLHQWIHVYLPAYCDFSPPVCQGYVRALFKVLQAHPGPYPAGHGEGLPPPLLHLRGLQLLPGRRALHRGRHVSDTLHRRLSQVRETPCEEKHACVC